MRAAVLAVLALVAFAGCGGSESGPHATQREIDAADQKWVESMLLTEDELPAGWSPDLDESPNPPDDCEQIDFSDLVITGEADVAFERGETGVLQNGIELYESADDAHESVVRGDAGDVERCLFEVAREELAADEVSIRNVQVTELDAPDIGEESRLFDITWDYVRRTGEGGLTSYVAGAQAQSGERAPFDLRLSVFRRDRSVAVVSAGEIFGAAPAEIVEPLARKLDKRLIAEPPPG